MALSRLSLRRVLGASNRAPAVSSHTRRIMHTTRSSEEQKQDDRNNKHKQQSNSERDHSKFILPAALVLSAGAYAVCQYRDPNATSDMPNELLARAISKATSDMPNELLARAIPKATSDMPVGVLNLSKIYVYELPDVMQLIEKRGLNDKLTTIKFVDDSEDAGFEVPYETAKSLPKLIAMLPNLRELDLYKLKISPECMRPILQQVSKSKNLERLSLGDHSFYLSSVVDLLNNNTVIKDLELGCFNLHYQDSTMDDLYAALCRNDSITRLHLHTDFSAERYSMEKIIKVLKDRKITEYFAYQGEYISGYMGQLIELSETTNLRHLEFFGVLYGTSYIDIADAYMKSKLNTIDVVDCQKISKVYNEQNQLQKFHVYSSIPDVESVQELLLANSISLTTLTLNYASSCTRQILPIINKLTNIEKLDLSKNSLSDEEVEILAKKIVNLPNLRELNLSYCSLSNKSAILLAKALKNNIKLEVADFSHNEDIEYSGVKKLVKAIGTKDVELNLCNTYIGRDAVLRRENWDESRFTKVRFG